MYFKVFNVHQNYIAVKKSNNVTALKKRELLTYFLEELRELNNKDVSRNFSSDILYLYNDIQKYLNTL